MAANTMMNRISSSIGTASIGSPSVLISINDLSIFHFIDI